MEKNLKKTVSNNKKAYFDYLVFDKYTAGIALMGTEIKSARSGAMNLKDSFIKIENNEAILYNCHISPYGFGNRFNHEPVRPRKLLLHKKEILKIVNKQKQGNYTIIPLEAFLSKGYLKIEIALCKGKKLYDKREALKKKDIQRNIKNY